MEDGDGDEDGGRRRETRMKDGSEDEDGGRRRETGRRTVSETRMDDGNVYVALRGAPHKTLYHNDLTLFRVGIFTTLKSVKHLSISHLQVTLNVSS